MAVTKPGVGLVATQLHIPTPSAKAFYSATSRYSSRVSLPEVSSLASSRLCMNALSQPWSGSLQDKGWAARRRCYRSISPVKSGRGPEPPKRGRSSSLRGVTGGSEWSRDNPRSMLHWEPMGWFWIPCRQRSRFQRSGCTRRTAADFEPACDWQNHDSRPAYL